MGVLGRCEADDDALRFTRVFAKRQASIVSSTPGKKSSPTCWCGCVTQRILGGRGGSSDRIAMLERRVVSKRGRVSVVHLLLTAMRRCDTFSASVR